LACVSAVFTDCEAHVESAPPVPLITTSDVVESMQSEFENKSKSVWT